jgi:hypothetical protein
MGSISAPSHKLYREMTSAVTWAIQVLGGDEEVEQDKKEDVTDAG